MSGDAYTELANPNTPTGKRARPQASRQRRLRAAARLQREGQPELPEPHRLRTCRAAARRRTRPAIAHRPAQHAATSSRATTTTAAVTAPAAPRTALDGGRDLGRRDHPQRLHPRRRLRRGARSTGRPAATRRWPGTPRATPTWRASCSTAAPASRRTRTSRARSTCSARPGTTARRGTSRAVRSTEFNDTAGTGAALLRTRQYMTVDNNVGSPFQDRVYVTWTEFAADGTGYIYEAHSDDYGETFSAPVLVSGDSPRCARNTFGLPTPQGTCNENQFSQPFAGARRRRCTSASANFNNGRSTRRTTTTTRCCWPSRPTAADVLARRSRSATTTTCPTAPPTRRRRPGPRLRAGEGPIDQLGVPRHQLPVRRGQPDEPEPGRGDLRLLHQQATPTRPTAASRPGFAADGTQHLHRRQGRRRRATTTSSSASRPTAARRSPATTTDPRQMPTVTSAPQPGDHRPVLAVGAFTRNGTAARRLLRPPVRQRRDDRLLGLQPSELAGPGRRSA